MGWKTCLHLEESEQYDGMAEPLKEFMNSRGHEEMTGGPGRGSRSLAEPMTAWLRGELGFLYRLRDQVDPCPVPTEEVRFGQKPGGTGGAGRRKARLSRNASCPNL